MNNDLRQNAEKYGKRYRLKRLWHRVVSVLSCIVVFCTTYALILPAITQIRTTFCGKEPHIHTEKCYTQIIEARPQGLDLIASDSNADKILICTLPEHQQHIHDDSCYKLKDEHTHDETCYVIQRGKLLCELTEAHVHDDHCYGNGEMICTTEESHIHDEGCYSERELICTCTMTDSNAHSDSCYSEPILLCEIEENHVHQDFPKKTGKLVPYHLW